MAKIAKKKPFKATPATKRRSRGDIVKQIALGTELKPRQVKEVFDDLAALIAADLGKKGCGEFNFMGLMKLRTVNKPATAARKGKNPFTGEEIMMLFEELHHAGNTIILVTHEADIAEHAHRTIRLRDGKIESDEPVKKRRVYQRAQAS
jgi:nucleoid DNA-binding protein